MAMTIIHVAELLQEANSGQPFERFDLSHDFPLAMGAGAVDPDLIEPRDQQHDVEEVIAFRCSTL